MLNLKIDKRNVSEINRHGLFAKEVILEGELIWSPTENHIKKISLIEFEKLSVEDKQIWIDHCYQIDDYFQMDIDDTRFMNHSCEPNTMDFPADDKAAEGSGNLYLALKIQFDDEKNTLKVEEWGQQPTRLTKIGTLGCTRPMRSVRSPGA